MTGKDRVFATLRREILAARLMVTLDEELHRDTLPTVKRLAEMKLPPLVRQSSRFENVKTASADVSRSKAMQ